MEPVEEKVRLRIIVLQAYLPAQPRLTAFSWNIAQESQMSLLKNRADSLCRKVEIFDSEQESWHLDHESAMRCFLVEELIKDGNEIYGHICRLDIMIHRAAARLNIAPPELDRLEELFRKWLAAAEKTEELHRSIARDFDARGFGQSDAEEFYRNIKDCRANLNPSMLVCEELYEAALAEHRRGETVPMGWDDAEWEDDH